jgi:hypothetical protein
VSYYGKTELRFATGTTGLKSEFSKTQKGVGAAEYQCILSDTLLPQAKQLFGRHSVSDWVFQQDGAPAHTAYATRELLKAQGVQVLPSWPPNWFELDWEHMGLDGAGTSKAPVCNASGAENGVEKGMERHAIANLAS